MKNLVLLMASGVMLLSMASCSGDGSPLSASSAKSAIKKEAMFAKDSQVAQFEIGFREVTEGQLQQLARLKAAGVIEYTTEKVVETRQYRDWEYWTGYYTVTKKVVHVFADVKLTKQGQKLVVENPTVMRDDLAKLLKANEDYEERVPDYMSATDNAFGEETTAEEVAVVEPVEEVVADTVVAVVEEVAEIAEAMPEPEPAKPAKEDPNAAYKAMQERVSTETVNVLLGKFELVDVYKVLCTEDMFKAGKGSCELIYKFVDKTPFGFVLGAPDEGFLNTASVSFIHYQDTGWSVAQ